MCKLCHSADCQARHQHGASFSGTWPGAFTLVEILIALGLVAIIAGVMIVAAGPILDRNDEGGMLGTPPIEEVFRRAVRQARYHASASKQPAVLSFDPLTSNFTIDSEYSPPEDEPDRENAIKRVFRTGYEPEDPELKVSFYQLMPGQASQLGNAFEPERLQTNRIVFHPDRSSTPFEVIFEVGLSSIRQRYDLFSDGLLIDERSEE